jgi:hypothetical protein
MSINSVQQPLELDSSAHGDFHFYKMKIATWNPELGFSIDKYVEVAPVARPGHPRVCGRKISPQGLPLLYIC